jgi:hypothetical protein
MRFLVLALIAVACTPTDVGQCCQVAEGADPSIVPPPAFDAEGQPANTLSRDPKLLCEQIACVSFQGSMPYCTQSCEFDASCPSGFQCLPVIASDPGEGSTTGAHAKFCVKVDHACE